MSLARRVDALEALEADRRRRALLAEIDRVAGEQRIAPADLLAEVRRVADELHRGGPAVLADQAARLGVTVDELAAEVRAVVGGLGL